MEVHSSAGKILWSHQHPPCETMFPVSTSALYFQRGGFQALESHQDGEGSGNYVLREIVKEE